MRKVFLKWIHYEYWPMWCFYTPLFFWCLMKGIKHKHFFFFTNVNKNVDEFGGLFFDSKSIVDRQIPLPYRVDSRVLRASDRTEFNSANMNFPLIVKPDKGERGKDVYKVNSTKQLEHLLYHTAETILIQEYISLPLEYSVFICWVPEMGTYKILSLTEKQYFTVRGDGISPVSRLIKRSTRGLLLYDEIIKLSNYKADYIPQLDEVCLIHEIGNHAKGCQFFDASHRINEKMTGAFNLLLQQIGTFEYGRFDIKVQRIDDLETFKNIKIIEFNGLASEPTIIYDEKTGYWGSLKQFIRHWKYLENLSIYNQKQGIQALASSTVFNKIVHRLLKKSA